MELKYLTNIIREIIQGEFAEDPRGGGIQANQSNMGMWHSDKGTMYREKAEGLPYLWTIETKKGDPPPETKQTPKNFPNDEDENDSVPETTTPETKPTEEQV